MIKVGIIGGAGYTAGELLRILINHPDVEIVFVHSTSNANTSITDVHTSLIGETDLVFASEYDLQTVDVVFMCSGHGKSSVFWTENQKPEHLKVIDLAQDFRDESNGYIYGLPELQREKIKQANLIANPGCFATAIQLAILPLAKNELLKQDIQVTAITGSTGAGVKPGATTHFSWRNNNLSVYKAFEHQHLLEINRNIKNLQPDYQSSINFVPMRGDFSRGIMAVTYTETDLTEEEAKSVYQQFYADAKFTFVAKNPIDLKQVVNTNKAILQVEKHGKLLMVVSAIDNLLKGASGQAVQNMNLIFGLDERCGLALKSSAF